MNLTKMTTPPIPSWIKEFRHGGFENIFDSELCPETTRLYGTESLYGEWNGELLLLAKDFAPSSLIRDRRKSGDSDAYHHSHWEPNPLAPGAKTNRNLYKHVQRIQCRKLYGSAYACLLRADGRVGGPLKTSKILKDFIRRVLHFTESQMPNLRVIACLGSDAWKCAAEAHDLGALEWNEYRVRHKPVDVKTLDNRKIKLIAMKHPSRPDRQVNDDWEAVKIALVLP